MNELFYNLSYVYGYLLGLSLLPGLIFKKSLIKSGSKSGNLRKSILLIILFPLLGFYHLKGVALFKNRRNHINDVSINDLEYQFKQGYLTIYEYETLMDRKSSLTIKDRNIKEH